MLLQVKKHFGSLRLGLQPASTADRTRAQHVNHQHPPGLMGEFGSSSVGGPPDASVELYRELPQGAPMNGEYPAAVVMLLPPPRGGECGRPGPVVVSDAELPSELIKPSCGQQMVVQRHSSGTTQMRQFAVALKAREKRTGVPVVAAHVCHRLCMMQ